MNSYYRRPEINKYYQFTRASKRMQIIYLHGKWDLLVIWWRFEFRVNFENLLYKIVTFFLQFTSSTILSCIQPFTIATVYGFWGRGSVKQKDKLPSRYKVCVKMVLAYKQPDPTIYDRVIKWGKSCWSLAGKLEIGVDFSELLDFSRFFLRCILIKRWGTFWPCWKENILREVTFQANIAICGMTETEVNLNDLPSILAYRRSILF